MKLDCRQLECELAAARAEIEKLSEQNGLFRNETLICADCDAIRKEEYDQAIEQRDRLQKIVDEQCRVSSVCREYREQRDRAWQTIAEIKRDIMEDETFGDVVIKLWQEPLDEAIEQRDRLVGEIVGWRNKWECAVEIAAQAEVKRDRLAEALEQILEYQGRFAEEDPQSIAREALQSLTTNEQ
jgi:hypothetical protein